MCLIDEHDVKRLEKLFCKKIRPEGSLFAYLQASLSSSSFMHVFHCHLGKLLPNSCHVRVFYRYTVDNSGFVEQDPTGASC